MNCPNSNWYFKLKGLTFLTIATAIILIQFNIVNELNLQYLAAFLMAIWGIAYLSYNQRQKPEIAKEKNIELKEKIIESTAKAKTGKKTEKAKKSIKKKN